MFGPERVIRPERCRRGFHHAVDETRVLNYAEWTVPAARDVGVGNAELGELCRIGTETPGSGDPGWGVPVVSSVVKDGRLNVLGMVR